MLLVAAGRAAARVRALAAAHAGASSRSAMGPPARPRAPYVVDLGTASSVYARRADVDRACPASVEKLYTTSTALLRLGAGRTG